VTLLDTSALIDHLVDGALAERVEDLLATSSASVSAISVFELLAGVTSEKHVQERRQLISLLRVIPVSSEIADRAAALFTALRSAGVTIDNEDLIVAATAIVEQQSLLTANKRHFRPVAGLSLVE